MERCDFAAAGAQRDAQSESFGWLPPIWWGEPFVTVGAIKGPNEGLMPTCVAENAAQSNANSKKTRLKNMFDVQR
jgi:hypothetical protein